MYSSEEQETLDNHDEYTKPEVMGTATFMSLATYYQDQKTTTPFSETK
jgi:hypothetical protein